MTLSKAQIERLFEFTHQQHVKYDDVKYEIVDHLASDIEAQMSKEPNLDFEKALYKAFRKFPLTGFYHFVETKEKALREIWRLKLIKIIRGYFTPPKLLLFVAIFSSLLLLGTYRPNNFELTIFIPVAFLYVYVLISKKFPVRIFRKEKVNYLFLQAYRDHAMVYMILPLFLPGLDLYYYTIPPLGFILTCAIYAYVFIVLIALIKGDFKKELINEIEAKYQHLNIELNQVVVGY